MVVMHARRLSLTVLSALVAAGLGLGVPSLASAAYPGSNGKLVYFQNDVGSEEPLGLSILDGGAMRDFGPRCAFGLDPQTNPCPKDPTWSPDGSQVAFGYGDDLGVIGEDGIAFRVIDLGALRSAGSPTWNPSGTVLAFSAVACQGCVRTIYRVPATGGPSVRIVAGRHPAWSVRGTLAFSRVLGEGSPAPLYLRARDGTVRRITRGSAFHPTWAPGGRALAFTKPVSRTRNGLSRYELGSRHFRQLAGVSSTGARQPSWAPDGRIVLYEGSDRASNDRIYAVPSSGGATRTITSGEEGRRFSVASPDLQPLP